MAQRPFVPYQDFDVEAFVDYGKMHYDLNVRVDGPGVKFPGQKTLQRKRALIARREAKRGH
jgi:hypothetical protein